MGLIEHGEVALDRRGFAGDGAVGDHDGAAAAVVAGHNAAGIGEEFGHLLAFFFFAAVFYGDGIFT